MREKELTFYDLLKMGIKLKSREIDIRKNREDEEKLIISFQDEDFNLISKKVISSEKVSEKINNLKYIKIKEYNLRSEKNEKGIEYIIKKIIHKKEYDSVTIRLIKEYNNKKTNININNIELDINEDISFI